MALTQTRVFQAIQSTLGPDATIIAKAPGGVFLDDAPASLTTTPWIVYSQLTTLRDIQGRGAQLVMGKGLIQVQAVGRLPTDAQSMQDAIDRVDALLNGLKGLTIGGATIVRLARDRELSYSEVINGVRFGHWGIVYQWWAQ